VKRKRYDGVVDVHIRIPLDLRERLRAAALQLGLTDVEAIRIAIAAFVENKALHAAIREFHTCNYMRRRKLGL
jgi:predicted DNA-binding protein